MTTREGDANSEPKQQVEVVYALPDRQAQVCLAMPPAGLTAAQAIRASGLREKFPELDRDDLVIGVFGTICDGDRLLQPGDRVEIYRPLRNDPRAMRRARAAQARTKARGRG